MRCEINTNIPQLPSEHDGKTTYGELKKVFPTPRLTEHSVYVLASNALHAYTKLGEPICCAV